MKFPVYRFIGLLALLSPLREGWAQPGAAPRIEYTARLSARDHVSSKGQSLTELAAILRQDRANFHNQKWRDPEDQSDPLFTTGGARNAFDSIPDTALEVDAALRGELLSGSPVVKVEITGKPGTSQFRIKVTRAGVASGQRPPPQPRSEKPGAELTRRFLAQCGAGPFVRKVPGKSGLESHTVVPKVPHIDWRTGQTVVAARTALYASCGAFTHDGKRAMFEAAPGLLELWDMGANVRIASMRMTDGSVMAIARAADPGWMLCVCTDDEYAVSILLVPTTPPHQPRLLWWVNSDPEYTSGNDDLSIVDVRAGRDAGELLILASPVGSASGSADGLHKEGGMVLFRPVERSAQFIASKAAIETRLFALYPGNRIWKRGFSPIAEYIADDPASPSAAGLRFLPGDGGLARRTTSLRERNSMVLDEHLGQWLTTDLRCEDSDADWLGSAPQIGRAGELALRRPVGTHAAHATLQDVAADGSCLLVRLSLPLQENSSRKLTGYDPWLHGLSPAPEQQMLVMLNLHTLESTVVATDSLNLAGVLDNFGRLVVATTSYGKEVRCRVQPKDGRGNDTGPASLLTIRGAKPFPDTFALESSGDGRFRLSWGDGTQSKNYTVGDLIGRACVEFDLKSSAGAKSKTLTAGRELFAVNRSGTRLAASKEGHPFLRAAESPTGEWFSFRNALKAPAAEPLRLIFGDGGGAKAYLSPQGGRGVAVLDDDPYVQSDILSWHVVSLKDRKVEYTVNGFQNDIGRGTGLVGGDACAWVDETGFLFFTAAFTGICEQTPSGEWRAAKTSRTGGLPNRALPFPGGRRAAVSRDNAVEIWEITPAGTPSLLVSLFFDHQGRATAVSAAQYFAGRTRTGSSAYFVRDGKALTLEQFDLQLNRPDRVLGFFGAPQEIIAAAEKARARRTAAASFSSESGVFTATPPQIILTADPPAATAAESVELTFRASDPAGRLQRLLVRANGIPVGGKDGLLPPAGSEAAWTGNITVPLAARRTVIRLSCLNAAGLESRAIIHEVEHTGADAKGTLFVAALGVSLYQQNEFNLNCAARDAKDLSAALRQAARGGLWAGSKVLCLTDDEVAGDVAGKVRTFLAKAAPADTVVMFVAGHGVLDARQNYWFATSDFDFAKPGTRGGLLFAQLETILGECAATAKLGLMDTCHAGELTNEERTQLAAASSGLAARGIKARTFTTAPASSSAAPGLSAGLMSLGESFFADFRTGTGATFIVSSGGAEFAYESDAWNNGAFTKSVLEALKTPAADASRDGLLDAGELFDFCEREVIRLTQGLQRPRLRGFNRDNPFPVSSVAHFQ